MQPYRLPNEGRDVFDGPSAQTKHIKISMKRKYSSEGVMLKIGGKNIL